MRLLNTETYELKSFELHEAPPYAILSHTWGDNELTYQDLNQPADTRDAHRWRKVYGTSRLARDADLQWIWIDTCNIDKSSSAELSEAINSMFTWYRHARLCFVYLEDVKAQVSTHDEVTKQLPQSRWFKRGWTLQELLAPQTVNFYSAEWKYIGSKQSLRRRLVKITGIDHAALTSAAILSTLSIAHRMSWAAKRETSRLEDIAYCLMGIFEVNMPLLYGEGRHAFIRLQKEIIRNSSDQSIFAWEYRMTDVPSAYWTWSGDGILAGHPVAFIDSGGIQCHRNSLSQGLFAVTNQGLSIEARLWSDCSHHWWILPCYPRGSAINVFAIPIIPSQVRERHYQRNKGAKSKFMCLADISNAVTKSVYLDLDSHFYSPGLSAGICHLRSHPSSRVILKDAIVVRGSISHNDLGLVGGPRVDTFIHLADPSCLVQRWDMEARSVYFDGNGEAHSAALHFDIRNGFAVEGVYVILHLSAKREPDCVSMIYAADSDHTSTIDPTYNTSSQRTELAIAFSGIGGPISGLLVAEIFRSVSCGIVVHSLDISFVPETRHAEQRNAGL